MQAPVEAAATQPTALVVFLHELASAAKVTTLVQHRYQSGGHDFRVVYAHLLVFLISWMPQQVVTQAIILRHTHYSPSLSLSRQYIF